MSLSKLFADTYCFFDSHYNFIILLIVDFLLKENSKKLILGNYNYQEKAEKIAVSFIKEESRNRRSHKIPILRIQSTEINLEAWNESFSENNEKDLSTLINNFFYSSFSIYLKVSSSWMFQVIAF